MVRCKHGRLASPVREPRTGNVRHCKLARKTRKGRRQDYRKASGEYHELRYRRDKRRGKR